MALVIKTVYKYDQGADCDAGRVAEFFLWVLACKAKKDPDTTLAKSDCWLFFLLCAEFEIKEKTAGSDSPINCF